ncbi:MAG: hypothetical protein UMU76_08595, partial [Prosthecochloris sp.]|nr:hypothetical protein [Prosthecochloris sp.]
MNIDCFSAIFCFCGERGIDFASLALRVDLRSITAGLLPGDPSLRVRTPLQGTLTSSAFNEHRLLLCNLLLLRRERD